MFGIPLFLLAPLTAVVCFLAGGCGPLIARRIYRYENLHRNNEVAGAKFGAIASFYSVQLAFIVVAVWNSYTQADAICQQEAGECQVIYRLSGGLGEAKAEPLRAAIKDYVKSVIHDEWPLMSRGGSAPATVVKLERLFDLISGISEFGPTETGRANVHSQILESVSQLSQKRNLRMLSGTTDVPGILWMILILGAVATVAFASFFGSPNVYAQAAMSGTVAMLLGLILLAIFLLDNNFTGDLSLKPGAYEHALRSMEVADAGRLSKP